MQAHGGENPASAMVGQPGHARTYRNGSGRGSGDPLQSSDCRHPFTHSRYPRSRSPRDAPTVAKQVATNTAAAKMAGTFTRPMVGSLVPVQSSVSCDSRRAPQSHEDYRLRNAPRHGRWQTCVSRERGTLEASRVLRSTTFSLTRPIGLTRWLCAPLFVPQAHLRRHPGFVRQ